MHHPLFISSLVDVPRPGVDRVSTLQEALGVISLAARHPLTIDTIVLGLDDRLRGVGLARVPSHPRDGGSPSDRGDDGFLARTIHDIISWCVRTPSVREVVVASFRPSSPIAASDVRGLARLVGSLASAGYTLRDWVVSGRGGFYCPRVLTDSPDPWEGARGI